MSLRNLQFTFALSLLFITVFSSCVSNESYSVEIQSKSKEYLPPKKAYLIHSNVQQNEIDLVFLRNVKIALKNDGFTITNEIENAEQLIYCNYSIKDADDGNSIPAGNRVPLVFDSSFANYPDNHIQKYIKEIIIRAFDASEYASSGEMILLWETIISSTGRIDDFSHLFPYLFAASEEHYAHNKFFHTKTRIYTSDERLKKYMK